MTQTLKRRRVRPAAKPAQKQLALKPTPAQRSACPRCRSTNLAMTRGGTKARTRCRECNYSMLSVDWPRADGLDRCRKCTGRKLAVFGHKVQCCTCLHAEPSAHWPRVGDMQSAQTAMPQPKTSLLDDWRCWCGDYGVLGGKWCSNAHRAHQEAGHA